MWRRLWNFMVRVATALWKRRRRFTGVVDPYDALPGTQIAIWRAEDATEGDGIEVIALPDKVAGYVMEALEGGGSGGPILMTDVQNGYAALDFDGAEANMFCDDAALLALVTAADMATQDLQFIVVARANVLDATEDMMFNANAAGAARHQLSNRNDVKIVRTADDDSGATAMVSTVSSADVAVWEIWEYRRAAATGKFWINGTLENTQTPVSQTSACTPDNVGLCSNNFGAVNRLDAHVLEAIILTGASEADMAEWRTFLQTKYDV